MLLTLLVMDSSDKMESASSFSDSHAECPDSSTVGWILPRDLVLEPFAGYASSLLPSLSSLRAFAGERPMIWSRCTDFEAGNADVGSATLEDKVRDRYKLGTRG